MKYKKGQLVAYRWFSDPKNIAILKLSSNTTKGSAHFFAATIVKLPRRKKYSHYVGQKKDSWYLGQIDDEKTLILNVPTLKALKSKDKKAVISVLDI